MSTHIHRLLARAIHASVVVDRAARRFDQARSALVTRLASHAVLDAFNDLAYERTPVYRAGAPEFRQALFNWEIEAIARAFPDPPGRVLVGGAGGGREAFALASRGYQVVAFEPSAALARSLADHAPPGATVEAFVGRFKDLPWLTNQTNRARVDMRQQPPFDAALFGWTSFSHLRTRDARVAALRNVAGLTNGPVLASFYTGRPRPTPPAGIFHSVAQALGLRFTGDLFTPYVGFYHLSTPDELVGEVRDAGLDTLHASFDELDGRWPYLIVQPALRPDQKPLTSSRQPAMVSRSGESART